MNKRKRWSREQWQKWHDVLEGMSHILETHTLKRGEKKLYKVDEYITKDGHIFTMLWGVSDEEER